MPVAYQECKITGVNLEIGSSLDSCTKTGRIDLVTNKDITAFENDGVAFLPGIFEQRWIDTLLQGVSGNIANPSERGRTWDRDAQGRTCFYDSQVWREIGAYEDFAINSPCAELAGRLMGSSKVNFFFDAIFVPTPGTEFYPQLWSRG